MKLEPTEAQRKAMGEAADEWQGRVDTTDEYIDRIIAAANSIPEGAPVGAIARRPDGEWVAARRVEDEWSYIYVGAFGKPGVEGEWPEADSADYWPQIRPKEWPDSTRGSRELPIGTIVERPDHQARAWREDGYWSFWKPYWSDEDDPCIADDVDSWPVIYDPTGKTLDELHVEIDRLDKAEDSALRERDYWEETVNRILYTCSSAEEIGEWSSANDPVERFIEQFKPVKRIDPTAQQEPAFDLVADHQQRVKFKDATGRKPRVVDRLGVEEQDAEWMRRGISRDSYVWEYRFRNEVWQVRLVGNEVWASMAPGTEPTNGPFTEVLEPRVLPSLDCEEARDGTVWSLIVTASGTKRLFQYRDSSWHTRLENALWKQYDGAPSFCTTGEKFTEVLGDPS